MEEDGTRDCRMEEGNVRQYNTTQSCSAHRRKVLHETFFKLLEESGRNLHRRCLPWNSREPLVQIVLDAVLEACCVRSYPSLAGKGHLQLNGDDLTLCGLFTVQRPPVNTCRCSKQWWVWQGTQSSYKL